MQPVVANHGCYFGICAQSEAQAWEMVVLICASGLAAFAAIVVTLLVVWFVQWRRRNAAMDFIDAVLDDKPVKSGSYESVRSPFW